MAVAVQAHPGYPSDAAAAAELRGAGIRSRHLDRGKKRPESGPCFQKFPQALADAQAGGFAVQSEFLAPVNELSVLPVDLVGFQLRRVRLGRPHFHPVLLEQKALYLPRLISSAYIAMILSSKPSKRLLPLAISNGSKLPSRSRGTAISITPLRSEPFSHCSHCDGFPTPQDSPRHYTYVLSSKLCPLCRNSGSLTHKAGSGSDCDWKSPIPASNSSSKPRRPGK